mgnify:CR=1 FL=1
MLQNSYDNYTQKPQLNAKLKVLRKIIAFVFAINMLITRFFGGPAGTQLRQAEVFTDSSASQTYVTDSVYSTDLPSILSAEDFDTSVTASLLYTIISSEIFITTYSAMLQALLCLQREIATLWAQTAEDVLR